MVKTQTQSLNVLAAGSLRKALSPHLTQFSQQFGVNIHVQFGPAGLLREQIERGASWDLFASANLQHPQKLQEQRLTKSIMPFLRNRLCLTARRTCMNSESDSWLELLTNTQLRIGTSTPGCDPSGDYTWQLFDRVEALRPHAGESLKQRALQLVGGIDSLQVPPNEIASGWLIQQGLADVFVGYAHYAQWLRNNQTVAVVNIPDADNVFATYALALRDESARPLAEYLLSPRIQQQFINAGFSAR
ncbi:substrate-binding domain-containing protein [Hafnia paralvei]|uniref:substrate-binding domain-containing protein n=1 Tax=Hafnia paralvei TaxID=546367 RepID=UPI003C306819